MQWIQLLEWMIRREQQMQRIMKQLNERRLKPCNDRRSNQWIGRRLNQCNDRRLNNVITIEALDSLKIEANKVENER
jgi:hypothetical protein